MNALRLLSCSTGLKLKSAPQEQQRSTSPLQGNGTMSREHLALQSKKRKRNDEEHQRNQPVRPVFHDGGRPASNEVAATGTVDTPDGQNGSVAEAPEEERRSTLKRCKIKVTDLRAIHMSGSRTSKKAQKEAARIFPRPMIDFRELRMIYDVNKALAENVADQGYLEPTGVQLASIPLLLGAEEGSEPDLLTIAPTGSGKTLAFLIPLVQKICRAHRKNGPIAGERHVSAIIIAPTKELVSQTVNEGRKLTARTGVSISEMRKGMRLHGVHEGRSDAKNGDEGSDSDGEDRPEPNEAMWVKSDILVTTPLHLVNAIAIGTSDLTVASTSHPLPSITNLILDEADILLDPLFRPQTLAIWSACTSPNLRISLWSATIGSNIEALALETVTSRARDLELSSKSSYPLLRVVVGLKDSALPPTITHKLIYAATEPGKLLGIRQLIHPPSALSQHKPKPSDTIGTLPTLRPPFLIFTQTIDRATALQKELLYDLPTPTHGQSRIAVLHSQLSSAQRSDTMTRFRKGSIWFLITTDLLSRGVDFRGINVVVNYDIPSTAASYVHRAGRTGRAGRAGGVCITMYTKEDVKYVKNIANVIAMSQKGQMKSADVTATSASRMRSNDVPQWLLESLPNVSRKDRADIKQRGVDVRRAVREGEEKDIKRNKMKARIGTVSGYDRRKAERREGAVEGSKRRKAKERTSGGEGGGEEWGGISD